MLKFRKATDKNTAKILAKMNKDFCREYTRDGYGANKPHSASKLKNSNYHLVYRDNIIVGYVTLFTGWIDDHELGKQTISTVDTIYIKPFFRGQGIATEIYQKVAESYDACRIHMSVGRMFETWDYLRDTLGCEFIHIDEGQCLSHLGLHYVYFNDNIGLDRYRSTIPFELGILIATIGIHAVKHQTVYPEGDLLHANCYYLMQQAGHDNEYDMTFTYQPSKREFNTMHMMNVEYASDMFYSMVRSKLDES